MKDWTGNKASGLTTNGARNYALEERVENDYYATEPRAVEMLLELEKFHKNIWEPACGGGHISRVLEENGYNVTSSDLVIRDFNCKQLDFLKVSTQEKLKTDIITNPPYKNAKDFVQRALDVVEEGYKVAMFLKLTFLESKNRKSFFEENPPKVIYVSSSRLHCARNGDFEKYKKGVGDAIAYCWYVWEKGFKGEPVVRWFN